MEVFLADLIEAQRAQGLEAFALVHGQPLASDPLWLWRVPVQAHLVYAPVALGYRRALRKAITHFQPDVLHLHLPNSSVFWALSLECAKELPWVVHWHSDVVVTKLRLSLALAYFAYRPLEQAVLERSNRIVVTSAPYLEASEPLDDWREKCVVVPLGLKPVDCSNAESEAKWSAGAFRILSIGRLAYYKGFETLIAAVAQVPGAELFIVGDGELREALERRVRSATAPGETPRIRLLGAVSEDEKSALLASCDLFCLASRERTEAFGVVLLEAMSHGRACLVSALDGSGMPWLIEVTGAGRTCDADNVSSWIAGIDWMMQHAIERQSMARQGHVGFTQRLTIDSCATSLCDVYRAAAGLGRPAHLREETLIVIPARNESATIGDLLNSLRTRGYAYVLVIDDLSEDGTGDIAQTCGARVLRPVLGLGAWGAMQSGIRYGLREGFGRVITMDADGQHEVGELPTLLAASARADVVIGAFPQRASRLRRIAWNWFRLLTGLSLTDLTSGFRCYSSAAMEVLASGEATLLDYQDVGTLLLLRKAGLRIIEVPVTMRERVDGISRRLAEEIHKTLR
jgi:glycosyltransferase involved in cell wall biosynthesis